MPDDQVLDQEQGQVAPELDAQAREMGWRPKEEFKGAEDKWVDAKTFVERGEHVLPIVKATAERLRKENTTLHTRTAELEAAVLAGQESIKALERYHQDDVKQKVEAARTKIKAELVAAKKSGDVETEVELTEELSKLNAAEETAATRDEDAGADKGTRKASPKDYTKTPEFQEWAAENPWFGPQGDKAKTAIAYQVGVDIKNANPGLIGRAYLDKVVEETNKELARLTGGRQASAKKVEGGKGGSGGNSGGNGGGKTWADLPSEAKSACTSYEQDLVGPNRRYKTQAEWRASYVKQYFTEV